MKRSIILLLALCAALTVSAGALEVDSQGAYCFTAADFPGEALAGVCITGLPDSSAGTLMLGARVVRPGDILTAGQLEKLTFQPLRNREDTLVTVTYLPIYENRVDKAATMTFSIRGKTDKAPVAEDSALETYRNLPNSGTLKVQDPEGGVLTYTLVRPPRRGSVTINADGSFTYTPKKNKVGTDSFTYTAADEGGNVSRQATVTITILKPENKQTYADTVGLSCRFAAEWMKNTGLFTGEKLGDSICFQPEKTVSRGEFVTMLVQSLGLDVDESADYTGFTDEIPTWLKPYLAAALRSGLTAGWQSGTVFGAQEPITGAQAAVPLQNARRRPALSTQTQPDEAQQALDAIAVMAQNGISLPDTALNRGQVAQALYQASRLSATAPGALVFARK